MDESPGGYGGYGAIGALEKAKETDAKPAKVGVGQNFIHLMII